MQGKSEGTYVSERGASNTSLKIMDSSVWGGGRVKVRKVIGNQRGAGFKEDQEERSAAYRGRGTQQRKQSYFG